MIRRCMLLSAAAAALCVLGTGCSRQPDKVVYNALEPTKVTLSPPVGTVRLVHGGRLGNTVVERHITYPNGDKGSLFYRSDDGSLRQIREVYADGKDKATAEFDKNEKLISGEVRRPDNTRYLYMKVLDSGVTQYTFYGPDDHKAVYREKNPDGTYQDTFYRADGSSIGKVDVTIAENNNEQDNWLDVYPNGRTITRRFRVQFMAPPAGQFSGGGQLISYFNQQDKLEYTQLWRQGNWQRTPMGNLHIEQVDEYDYTGTSVQRSLYFKDEDNVVSILGSKQTETIWSGGSGGGFRPFGLFMPFIGTVGVPVDLLLQNPMTPPTAPMPRVVAPQGPTPDPNPRSAPKPSGPTKVEVFKTYRLGEKDQPDVLMDTYTFDQRWNRQEPVLTIKRVFHSGTLLKEKRGDKEVTHEASENLHEPNVQIARLKGVKYDELLQARAQFQREDKSFLGQPDKKNPCQWYFK